MTDNSRKAQFMSLREAREELGISKVKMIQLVRESGVKLYDDPLDKRVKLVRKDDIAMLSQPKERIEVNR